MQDLTFSLASVGLAEIHGFQWPIGCFSLVFTWIEADTSSDQKHWGRLKACLGLRSYT